MIAQLLCPPISTSRTEIAVLPRQSQEAQKDHLGHTRDQETDSMTASLLNIDLVIAKSVVAQLSVVVHDLVLDLNDLWVVLEMQVSCNKAAVQFNNL